MMSRLQIAGMTAIAVLVAVAAIGATLVAAVTSHDFARRLGWTKSYCFAPPAAAPAPNPPARIDIPA